MAYYAGKCGSITINGTSYPLKSWELNSVNDPVEVSNFLIPNARKAFIPNLNGGTITAEGFYTDLGSPDAGTVSLMPTAGEYCTFVLGVGGGLGFTVTALTTELTFGQDINDAAVMSITAEITPVISTC